MEQLVALLDLLLKGEHVGLIGIMRPPQMPKMIVNEKIYELGSKQKVQFLLRSKIWSNFPRSLSN